MAITKYPATPGLLKRLDTIGMTRNWSTSTSTFKNLQTVNTTSGNASYANSNGTATGASGYGNGVFVQLARNGMARKSTDGSTWTHYDTIGLDNQWADQSATYYGWAALKYAGGIWIAIRFDGQIWSSTDAITWTFRATPTGFSGAKAYGLVYNTGTSTWGAWSYGSNIRTATSTDGITWTSRTAITAGSAFIPGAMGSINGRFVIFHVDSAGTTAQFSWSADMVTWTTATDTVFTSATARPVAFSNDGTRLVAWLGGSTTGYQWGSSTTASTWTANTTFGSTAAVAFYDAVWDGTRHVGFPDIAGGTQLTYYSTAGTGALTAGNTWTGNTSLAWNANVQIGVNNKQYNKHASSDGAGKIVVTEDSGDSGYARLVYTSNVTSNSWTQTYPNQILKHTSQIAANSSNNLTNSGDNNNFTMDGLGRIWALTKYSGVNTVNGNFADVRYSTDGGTTWTKPDISLNQEVVSGNSGRFVYININYVNGYLIALGYNIIWYSSDNGTTWSSTSVSSISTNPTNICYLNGYWLLGFVSASATRTVGYSTNLSSWSTATFTGSYTASSTTAQIASNGITICAPSNVGTTVEFSGLTTGGTGVIPTFQRGMSYTNVKQGAIGGGAGKFVYLGISGTISTAEKVFLLYSNDGMYWNKCTIDNGAGATTEPNGNASIFSITGISTSLTPVYLNYSADTGWVAVVYSTGQPASAMGGNGADEYWTLTSADGIKWISGPVFAAEKTSQYTNGANTHFGIAGNKFFMNLMSSNYNKRDIFSIVPAISIGATY
jgi:hypothetical protein